MAGSGKKLSKSDDTAQRRQENVMLSRYFDAQIAWIREPGEATLAAYRKVGDNYKSQYDRG